MASGPSTSAPVICPRSAILHSAAASSVDGIAGFDRLDRREDRDPRQRDAERVREVDRVLHDVRLGHQVGHDVDRGVGDEQRLGVGSARPCTKTWLMRRAGRAARPRARRRRHQLVGVEVALHQRGGARRRGTAPPRRRRPRAASRPRPDLAAVQDSPGLRGGLLDQGARADQDGSQRAPPRGLKRAEQAVAVAGPGDGGGQRRQVGAAPISAARCRWVCTGCPGACRPLRSPRWPAGGRLPRLRPARPRGPSTTMAIAAVSGPGARRLSR